MCQDEECFEFGDGHVCKECFLWEYDTEYSERDIEILKQQGWNTVEEEKERANKKRLDKEELRFR